MQPIGALFLQNCQNLEHLTFFALSQKVTDYYFVNLADHNILNKILFSSTELGDYQANNTERHFAPLEYCASQPHEPFSDFRISFVISKRLVINFRKKISIQPHVLGKLKVLAHFELE